MDFIDSEGANTVKERTVLEQVLEALRNELFGAEDEHRYAFSSLDPKIFIL
jgi:hypothetical protein